MSDYNYNDRTKNAAIEVTLLERRDRQDDSVWSVKTLDAIPVEDGSRYLPKGSEFKYIGSYEDDENEVYYYLYVHGILSACNISVADFQKMLEEYGEEE